MLVVVPALLLSGCGLGTHATAPTGPGLTGPVGPVARSCQGAPVTAADDVQQVIDSHPPGTTFGLSAGAYRLETPLVPKRGDALVGRQGAVLSGSKILTGAGGRSRNALLILRTTIDRCEGRSAQ